VTETALSRRSASRPLSGRQLPGTEPVGGA
jgi:hypothetical protein